MKIIKAGTNPEPTQFELDNRALARKAAAEGYVLLENDGILPLKDKKVALYGSGARMTVKGGTGSGQVRERYSVNIAQGMENGGFEIIKQKKLPTNMHGTGDTFTSVLCGKMLNGISLIESAKIATDFVSYAMEYSYGVEDFIVRGVVFEPLLHKLRP